MKRNRLNFEWGWLILILAGGWLHTGCTPPPPSSPEAGFLTARYRAESKHDAKAVGEGNAFAQTIAEGKLRGMQKGESLSALRHYLHQLETPLQVSPDALSRELSLSVSRRQTIVSWLQQHPDSCSFDAAKVSPAWHKEIDQVGQQLEQLRQRFDEDLTLARDKMASKSFAEAAQQCQAAISLDPENQEAQSLLGDIRQTWALDIWSKLSDYIDVTQGKVALQTQHYENDLLSEPMMLECEASLNKTLVEVDDFRVWAEQSPGSKKVLADRASELLQKETELADSRGILQAQEIWLLRQRHQHWAAYQYYVKAIATNVIEIAPRRTHQLQEHELAAIHLELKKAYERMLPDGMAFYIKNAAAASEGRGAHGLSLVLCRLAQELCEYAESQNMQLAPQVDGLRGALHLTLGKAQNAIKTGLARQLVVKDFQSQGQAGSELASRIYAEWLGRYGTGTAMDTPVPVWQVEIKRDAEKTSALDYVLSGAVSKCFADTLAPKELTVTKIEAGQSPSSIPNPDHKDAKNHPNIYEQEIFIYERRVSLHTKKAAIRADISLAHDNKSTVCSKIDEEFDGLHKKLPDIQLTDQEIEYRLGTIIKKTSADRNELKTSDLPPNKSADLASDRDIEAALIDYAKESVLTNLMEIVAVYPLDNLFDQALRNQENPVQSADYFGECLEYCSQLATLDKKLSPKTGGNWADWRGAVGDRIASLKSTEWRNAAPALKSNIDHLWDLSVDTAIKAADQMSRESGSL